MRLITLVKSFIAQSLVVNIEVPEITDTFTTKLYTVVSWARVFVIVKHFGINKSGAYPHYGNYGNYSTWNHWYIYYKTLYSCKLS